jgi:hypothetical protein
MNRDQENNSNKSGAGFGLPENYFVNLHTSLQDKIEWLDEHKNYPALMTCKKTNGFITPDVYFQSKADSFELLPYYLLNTCARSSGLELPQNYFETNAKDLSDKNEVESISGHFKMLAAIPKQNGFVVEQGYFEEKTLGLKSIVLKEKRTANIIYLFKRKKAMQSIAAALVLSAGVWAYQQYQNLSSAEDCGTLACLDRKELLKNKHLEALESEELYELADPEILELGLDDLYDSEAKPGDSIHGKKRRQLYRTHP